MPLFTRKEYTGVEYYKLYKFQCLKCNNNFETYLYGGNIPKCPTCFPYIPSKCQKEISL